MKFKKEWLADTIDNAESTVEDVMIDHGRWSVTHRRVFKHEGRFYETIYSVGATENQDESPYEYADEEVECREVIPMRTFSYVRKPDAL